MRLLIIAPEQIPVPPPVGGSVENCIYQITRQISPNHQVTVLSRQRGGYAAKSVQGHVTIVRVPGGSRSRYLANVLKQVKGKRYDMIQIDNRPRFVREVRKAFPWTPIAVFLHSTTFISAPMTSVQQAAADLGAADLIVGNSQSLQRELCRRFPRLKLKVKYVHLGVDLQQFKPPSPEQRRQERDKEKVSGKFAIVFAGRLIPLKGVPVLMKATQIVRRSVPSATLLIAGGTGKPEYKAYLRSLARTLRIPVAFKGYVPRSRMHRFYWTGDCFVCPSQRHEAFGLVNVEAMAAGTPCIGSRIGGIPEIIRHGRNGLLVSKYHSPEALAQSILSIANNPSLAKKLSAQAREDVVRMFGWRSTASKLEHLYANYLSKGKGT